MANDMESIRKQFMDKLKPDVYKELVEETRKKTGPDLFEFWASSLYEIFKSRKFHGTHLLEIASGPTVHNIASASAYFPHIVQSDLVEANRIALSKWLRGDSDALDWSQFLDMVAKVEGYSDLELGRREIEARIRAAVKSVVHCDMSDDHVVPPEVRMPYDVVLICGASGTAATDVETYGKILKRLNPLLRPGGALILAEVTGCSSWTAGGNEFHYFPVTENDLSEGLEAAGFGEIVWKFMEETPSVSFDYKKAFTLTCVKL